MSFWSTRGRSDHRDLSLPAATAWRQFALLLMLCLLTPQALFTQVAPSGADKIPPVSIADDGNGVSRVVEAQRFSLQIPYRSVWRSDQPEVRSGWLIVLEVNIDFVQPRQTRQPVLFAGAHPAEVTNVGWKSGYLIVIVPDFEAGEHPTLAELIFFFGTPMLPERVSVTRGLEELAAAQSGGITPLPPERLPLLPIEQESYVDVADLYAGAARRILRHAPDEETRARAFLAGEK